MKEDKVVITVKMPRDIVRKLDFYAALNDTTRSALIREAVKYYIKILEARHEVRPYKYVRLTS